MPKCRHSWQKINVLGEKLTGEINTHILYGMFCILLIAHLMHVSWELHIHG